MAVIEYFASGGSELLTIKGPARNAGVDLKHP